MTEQNNPLEHMATLLSEEMENVNFLILKYTECEVEMVPRLAAHLIASGGKRIRPLLTLASARMYGDTSDRPCRLAAAVELIHTATLLHDDVVDQSGERRGKASANAVFGNQASVLVGDFLFSRAFQLMVSDGSLEVLRILSDASAIISQGEVMQLAAAGNLDTGEDEYKNIVKAKTAALFAAACEIGPVIAGRGLEAADAMCGYGTNLGIAFQIADDVLDYNSSDEKFGKNTGDDFHEGKMTLPVIHAIAKADDGEREFWQRTLENLDQRPEDFKTARQILKRHACYESGMALAGNYAERAVNDIEKAPEGELKNVLNSLARFAVSRDC
jgi:octaprenyl-diphosphate synthase